MILKPKWLTKIEPGHWASKNLDLSLILNEGGGDLAYDSSGNGNHGTLVGDTRFVAGLDGPVLAFDGDDSVLMDRNCPAIDLTKDFSIVFSVRIDTTLSRTNNILTQVRGSTDRLNISTSFHTSNPQVSVYSFDGSDVRTIRTSFSTLFDGEWNQFVFVHTGSTNTWMAYQNGIDTSTVGSGTNPGSGAQPLRMGETLDGTLGYLYIYDRILSTSKIVRLYLDPYQMFKRGG